ncbi:MAG: hypothetical protein NXI10_13920 [bacterium]|nr:hypothetical protein [bacterium]
MKILLTLSLVAFMSFGTFAQVNFRTGDASLDTELNEINNDAKSDLSAFKDRLLSEHNLSGGVVDDLLEIMQPAEVLLSGRLKDILGIEIDVVVGSYERNKDKGWGAIAKDLGIKPGSAEFHALKGKSKNSNASGKGKGNSTGKGNSGKGKGKAKS